MEIELTPEQNEQYKDAILNDNEVSFLIDGKKAYTMSLTAKENDSNLSMIKSDIVVSHKVEKHTGFELYIKAQYKVPKLSTE